MTIAVSRRFTLGALINAYLAFDANPAIRSGVIIVRPKLLIASMESACHASTAFWRMNGARIAERIHLTTLIVATVQVARDTRPGKA